MRCAWCRGSRAGPMPCSTMPRRTASSKAASPPTCAPATPRHTTSQRLMRVHAQGSPDGEDSPPDQQILEAPAGSAIFLGALTPHASVRPLFDPFLDLRLASNVRAEPLCLKTKPCAAPISQGPNRSDRYRRTLIISYRTADNFPLYLSGERYTTEKAVHLISVTPNC